MWDQGLTWTKTHKETVTNPDGSRETMRVQGGPFFFKRWNISATKRLDVYFGFRPTSPWSEGFGNEGDAGMGFFGRLMKRWGAGNFGIACRIKDRT